MTIPTEYYKIIRKNPNLISYWRLNDLSGTKAIDWSGKFNLNGIYSGSPISDVPLIFSDVDAGSKLFGGSGQNMEIPNALPLKITGDLTLEFWINILSSGQTCTILSKMNSGFTFSAPFYVGLENGKIIFTMRIGISLPIVTSEVQPIGKILHIVCTRFGKKLSLYIDGEKVKSENGVTGSSFQSEQPIYIGEKGNNTLGFNGMIGEVAIYSGALGISEIQNHFNIGRQVIMNKPYYTTFDRPSYS